MSSAVTIKTEEKVSRPPLELIIALNDESISCISHLYKSDNSYRTDKFQCTNNHLMILKVSEIVVVRNDLTEFKTYRGVVKSVIHGGYSSTKYDTTLSRNGNRTKSAS